jgi:hypothetical protein
LLNDSKEKEAKEELVKLLEYHKNNQIEYTTLVNHLIRETGLYSCIHPDTANWDDRFVCEVFMDTRENEATEQKTLTGEI